MADNKKIYTIQINGIDQSIKQVDALSDALQFLDKKIKELESRSVSVTSTQSGNGTRNADLQTEDQLLKQIQQTEQQIANARREDYASLMAQKDILGDIVDEAKARAAAERLSANNYGSTMKGMKQELSDIKKVMQTTELGSEKFQEMTARAKELTEGLKKIEEAYGQFGRNVGNYKSAFDEVKKVTVQVGNTAREFNSVRDASRQLTQELKAMAIAGKEDTEEYKELAEAVHNFEMASRRAESAVNDLKASSTGMDDLLDTFESFAALGSIGQGLSAFFGFDNTEIQRSIQKLVALQNVLQGIEKIRQQMNTQEGIGKIFSKGNAAIDTFVAKITGAKVGINGLTTASRAGTIAVRGLSLALKGLGIGVAMYVITKVIDGISNLSKEMNSAEKQTNRLDEALKSLNKTFEARNEMLASSLMRGAISNEEFLSKQYQNQTDYLSEQISLLKERALLAKDSEEGGFFSSGFMDSFSQNTSFTGKKMTEPVDVKSYNWFSDLIPSLKITVHNVQEVEEEFKKCQEAVREGKDYFDKWGSGLNGILNSVIATVGDTERAMRGLGNLRLSEFIGSFDEVNEQFKNGQISAEEYARKIGELKNQLNDNSVLRSVIANLDKYIPTEEVRDAVNNIIGEIIRLDDAFNMTSPEQIHHWNQVRIDAMKEGSAKIKAQMDEDERYEISKYGKTQEQINLIHAKYNRKRLNQQEKYNEQANNNAKQHARELEAAEKELQSLRIQNMKDGLAKQLAQLEEERRQKIQKAKTDGIKVGEITEEINKLYDKKVLDAKQDWAYKIEQVYINMWNRIYTINHNNAQSNFELIEKQIKAEYDELQNQNAANHSGVNLGYSQKKRDIKTSPKGNTTVSTESDEAYTKRLGEEYQKRTELLRSYYSETERISIEEENKQYQNSIAKLNEAKNNELRTLKNSYSQQDHELEEHLKKGEITQAQYNEAVKRLAEERAEQEVQIQLKYQQQAEENEKQHKDKIVSFQQESDDAIVAHYIESMDALRNVNTSEEILNGIGFLNIAAVKRRNDKVIELYKKMGSDIENTINRLMQQLKRNDLTEEQRKKLEETIKELRRLLGQVEGQIEDTEKNTDERWSKLFGQIAHYTSLVGSALSSLVSALGDYTDQQYENEINKLQDYIDEYEEKLNEQREITQEHASEVDSIENELANARGARRQALIDKLNAEMEAQRASLAEEKRLEKEKIKLEDKKEKEEKERLKAQKKVQTIQAIINGAVAVTNALATQPVWLGVALAAVMAAASAVQIATINSAKYAQGGVIQGKSHAQGGVKVLGGQAEVEGGEYITNKVTTAKNVDLLEYINSKKKRINLEDLIEFYGVGSPVKKNIQTVRTKFADGGVVPTLRNDITINDRLLTAFEDYSNRPTVVSVVDIIDRTQTVNEVKTMAGLEV